MLSIETNFSSFEEKYLTMYTVVSGCILKGSANVATLLVLGKMLRGQGLHLSVAQPRMMAAA